jgi:hypothetical protein
LFLYLLVVFGLASAILSLTAYLPYLRDTYTGSTRPHRAAWLIWSVLAGISFFSQLHEGASTTLWFAGAQWAGTLSVLLLSVRRGKGVYLQGSDLVLLCAASAGLGLWYLTDTAVYALAISIGISLLGGTATVTKAYFAPEIETQATWALGLVGALCAVLSVGRFDPVLMAYPLYLITLNVAILTAMRLGRSRPTLARPLVASPVV